jgi:hypothetical protein
MPELNQEIIYFIKRINPRYLQLITEPANRQETNTSVLNIDIRKLKNTGVWLQHLFCKPLNGFSQFNSIQII